MISVIIPVYNAQSSVSYCIRSVLNQTYKDIELLLINDGSTDNSGEILEKFRTDSRVKVFHKSNEGLSSARNYGLDRVTGDYISFLDADDWLEPKTYEIVLRDIGSTDICVFGRFTDSPGQMEEWCPSKELQIVDGKEALRRLIIDGSIKQNVWDKVYKKDVFDHIRFPEGFNYEDLRVTYKIFNNADLITLVPEAFYHYRQNKGSISHCYSAANYLDLWSACFELYKVFHQKDEVYNHVCIKYCANSVFCAWGSLWCMDDSERRMEHIRIEEIVSFCKSHLNDVRILKWHLRLVVLLAARGNRYGMLIAYLLNYISRLFKAKKLFSIAR